MLAESRAMTSYPYCVHIIAKLSHESEAILTSVHTGAEEEEIRPPQMLGNNSVQSSDGREHSKVSHLALNHHIQGTLNKGS